MGVFGFTVDSRAPFRGFLRNGWDNYKTPACTIPEKCSSFAAIFTKTERIPHGTAGEAVMSKGHRFHRTMEAATRKALSAPCSEKAGSATNR
jgi:hypothetical protein